jgi:penicillin amidase
MKIAGHFAYRTIRNPFSTHYNDQAEIYNAGNFRKMMLNKKIIKTSTKLIFIPAK